MTGNDEVLETSEASRYLKINVQTVRRLARERQIPAFKVGGVWRFKRSSLDRWAGSQETRQQGRVLVVDDEQMVRDFVREVIEREGHQVDVASDGEQALDLMEKAAPDLVLLDLSMPGMDGPATLAQIRKRWGNLPVAILTGYPDSKLMGQTLEFSPVVLLVKPVRRQQIVDTVTTMLRAGEPLPSQKP